MTKNKYYLHKYCFKSVHPDQLFLQQNKQQKTLEAGSLQLCHDPLGDLQDSIVVGFPILSEQSAGMSSPTGSRSASGRGDFTSSSVSCTASLAAPLTEASSQPRDACSLSDRLSAATTRLGLECPE